MCYNIGDAALSVIRVSIFKGSISVFQLFGSFNLLFSYSFRFLLHELIFPYLTNLGICFVTISSQDIYIHIAFLLLFINESLFSLNEKEPEFFQVHFYSPAIYLYFSGLAILKVYF